MRGYSFTYINCFLTDENGNILNPYAPGAITYTSITPVKNAAKKQVRLPAGKIAWADKFIVQIKGYISLFMGNERISDPIPFRDFKIFYLYVPESSDLSFDTYDFKCWVDVISSNNGSDQLGVTVKVLICTIVSSETRAKLKIPAIERTAERDSETREVCVDVTKIYDTIFFGNEITLTYTTTKEIIKAEVYQYVALSDGNKTTYTNGDEVPGYGDRGILNPEEVSYCALYVNGVLQPAVNYTIAEGSLELNTDDAPPDNAPVIISFVTFRDENDTVLPAEVYNYNTVSHGDKTVFTDEDELVEYGDKGILDPEEVSFYNLYINGVLQPAVNYRVEKGRLTLLTTDMPPEGAPITLEFITVRNADNKILKVRTYIYNALAQEKNSYTNSDELKTYGNSGIPDPDSVSFHNLFINAVLQPSANYSVQQGLLTLNTDDLPLTGSPISLQFVSVYS